MSLTLDKLPQAVDEALHRKAQQEGRTVQEVAADALAQALGINGAPMAAAKLDLSDVVGTWIDDPEFDLAIRQFEQIDPELWK